MKWCRSRSAGRIRITRRRSRICARRVTRQLDEISQLPMDELLRQRYEKFRRIGVFAGDGA